MSKDRQRRQYERQDIKFFSFPLFMPLQIYIKRGEEQNVADIINTARHRTDVFHMDGMQGKQKSTGKRYEGIFCQAADNFVNEKNRREMNKKPDGMIAERI